ncbi:MAG: S1 RNA-binding domain-containing protein [Ruminococcus sp.]
MGIEVGDIYECKVTGVTKFGAFVELPGGKTGMVHISEIAHTFVNEIKDYIKVGQTVKVKVLPSDNGKIALSIKQATPKEDNKPPRQRKSKSPAPPVTGPGDFVWQSSQKPNSGSFEDMMSRFKQTSEDKMSDLKRSSGESRGYSRRGNSSRK